MRCAHDRGGIDKGQKHALAAFVRAVRTDSPMPIEVESLFDTSFVTLAATSAAANGAVLLLDEYKALAAHDSVAAEPG
jgi:hypothetical protein